MASVDEARSHGKASSIVFCKSNWDEELKDLFLNGIGHSRRADQELGQLASFGFESHDIRARNLHPFSTNLQENDDPFLGLVFLFT